MNEKIKNDLFWKLGILYSMSETEKVDILNKALISENPTIRKRAIAQIHCLKDKKQKRLLIRWILENESNEENLKLAQIWNKSL